MSTLTVVLLSILAASLTIAGGVFVGVHLGFWGTPFGLAWGWCIGYIYYQVTVNYWTGRF